MVLTAAEKQRRYRERLKQNREKYEESKRKHREHYHKVKRLVKDLTPKEKKNANTIWMLRQRAYRQRAKNLQRILDVTPPSSPVSNVRVQTPPAQSPSISSKKRGHNKVKKYRSKIYRENKKLQEEVRQLKKKFEKYKKRYNRIKHSERISEKNEKSNKNYKLLTNSIKEHYRGIKSHKEKRLFKSILKTDEIERSRKKRALLVESFGINREYTTKKTTNNDPMLLRNKIHQFFLRDDISRPTAGKKETQSRNGEKVQRRYLMDTMRRLHTVFKDENPDTHCSYYYFTNNRPFFVKNASIGARETCLCKKHVNFAYKTQALKKQEILQTSDLSDIVETTVCNDRSKDCMYNDCVICKNKKIEYDQDKIVGTIKYNQWVRKEVNYIKDGKNCKKMKNVKEEQCDDAVDLLETFEKDLIEFKKHVYNIKIQFHNFRESLNHLEPNECTVVVDFSENYSCKHHEEVQSHHFGGSRNQVSLHTVMVYTYDSENKYKAHSFCTISSSNCHQPAAIWAHLEPIMHWIRNEYETVDTIHFFSDGPSTQYRQKQNFYLLCTKIFEYGFSATTWSFYEAGHGKGPADGIGGFLKRTADDLVAKGNDIANATDFLDQLKDTSKINLFLIKEQAIKEIQDSLPKTIPRLIGTLKVHQIFTDKPNSLKYRSLSCFCRFSKRGFCNCLNPKIYQLNLQSTIQDFAVRQSDRDFPTSDEEMPLAVLRDIQNTLPRPSIYRTIYGSSSDTDGEETHVLMPIDDNPPANVDEVLLDADVKKAQVLIQDKENYRPISNGDKLFDICAEEEPQASISNKGAPKQVSIGDFLHVHVYGNDPKKKIYSYVCKALTRIEEDGEVRVMFLRVVGKDAKTFRLDKKDISYVDYEDIIQILQKPAPVQRGRQICYQFEAPINIFEK